MPSAWAWMSRRADDVPTVRIGSHVLRGRPVEEWPDGRGVGRSGTGRDATGSAFLRAGIISGPDAASSRALGSVATAPELSTRPIRRAAYGQHLSTASRGNCQSRIRRDIHRRTSVISRVAGMTWSRECGGTLRFNRAQSCHRFLGTGTSPCVSTSAMFARSHKSDD